MKVSEICPNCNFPFELCVCGNIKDTNVCFILNYKDIKWNKVITVVEFSNPNIHLKQILRIVKKKMGVGGVIKNNNIELQGKHYGRIIKILKELGYNYGQKIID